MRYQGRFAGGLLDGGREAVMQGGIAWEGGGAHSGRAPRAALRGNVGVVSIPTIPIVCIVVAYFLVYLPHFVAGSQRFKLAGGFDNKHPRDQTARLDGWAKRASAAHQNGHETFSPFAIAVVVAWVGHGSAQWLTT